VYWEFLPTVTGLSAKYWSSPCQIILDCTDRSPIDNAGLALLPLTYRKLSTMSIRLIVGRAQGTVRDILLLTKLDKMFSIYDSVALGSLGSKTGEVPRA